MMTSINPKNVNANNIQSNEVNIVPPTANSLFQRNNYGTEKQGINDGIGNNIKFKTNSNNYNVNFGNDNQIQLKNLQNFKNSEANNENLMKKMNYDYTNNNNISNNLNNLNLNYNNQNNSINLNLGLPTKKNFATPILKETGPQINQDLNNNKLPNAIDKKQEDKKTLNMIQPKKEDNNDYYLAEMEKLRKEINNLKQNNEYLNNQLKEEQRKNEQLISKQKAKDENENSILSEIAVCLQVSSYDEILPKLNEIINYLNNNVNSNNNNNINNNNKLNKDNKIRDELISKLQSLYLSLTGSNEKIEEVTIKILWRWIKHLINTVKQLALEKEKNIEIYQNNQEFEDCRDFCEELITELNLQSLDELKMFIENLLKQSNINIIKSNEELRKIPLGNNDQMTQQQFQMQNYHQDEENDEGEMEQEAGADGEGDGEGEGEGEEEMDDNQNHPQYANENEYDDNDIIPMARNQNMNMNMH